MLIECEGEKDMGVSDPNPGPNPRHDLQFQNSNKKTSHTATLSTSTPTFCNAVVVDTEGPEPHEPPSSGIVSEERAAGHRR